MDAKVLQKGKALLAEYAGKKGHFPQKLSDWLWTHKDELIADAGRLNWCEDHCKDIGTHWEVRISDSIGNFRSAIDTAIAAGEKK